MYTLEKNGDTRLDRPFYGTPFPLRVETANLWEELVALNLRAMGVNAYRVKQNLPKRDKMFSLHQQDLHIKLDKVRPLVVEVKARRNPWSFGDVLVGDVASYDRKMFTVGAIVVIDSLTGSCMTAPGDSSEWLRVKKFNKELSYSIPLRLFSPLDAFAQTVKDGCYN